MYLRCYNYLKSLAQIPVHLAMKLLKMTAEGRTNCERFENEPTRNESIENRVFLPGTVNFVLTKILELVMYNFWKLNHTRF